MKERLRKALRFITPKNAVGFLAYGWFAGVAATMILPGFPGVLGILVPFILYIPLYILATRNRAKQIEIAKFVNDVQKQVTKFEEEKEGTDVGRATSDEE